jgi:hypothetical protein
MLLPARPSAAAPRRSRGAPARAEASRATSSAANPAPPACAADWRSAVFAFWAERGGERDARTLVALAEDTPSLRDPSSLKRSVATLESLLPGASVAAMVARHPPVSVAAALCDADAAAGDAAWRAAFVSVHDAFWLLRPFCVLTPASAPPGSASGRSDCWRARAGAAGADGRRARSRRRASLAATAHESASVMTPLPRASDARPPDALPRRRA